MLTPYRFDSPEALLKGERVRELLMLNKVLQSHGLQLTRENAEEILECRKRALKNQGRVELDTKVTQMFVLKLSESPDVTQENFVRTVDDLYEVFHFLKNKTSDHVGDEELVDAIITYFEKVCGGSSELLMGKGIEKIMENFRERKQFSAMESEGDEEYWSFDE